jgi:hypothetical protein
MDEGMYTRWINWKLIITPSLTLGFHMNITGNFGKDQDIKDMLYDMFRCALEEDFEN